MSPCLVQQLFRQKIGQELDQGLVDEVLFPMLRKQKHLSRELLLDIKMTQSSNENGLSAIIMPRHLSTTQACGRFTPIRGCPRPRPLPPPGKTTSKFRRKMMSERDWGSIEILNELRELNHPHIGYHISQDHQSNVLEFPTDGGDVQFPSATPERSFFGQILQIFLK